MQNDNAKRVQRQRKNIRQCCLLVIGIVFSFGCMVDLVKAQAVENYIFPASSYIESIATSSAVTTGTYTPSSLTGIGTATSSQPTFDNALASTSNLTYQQAVAICSASGKRLPFISEMITEINRIGTTTWSSQYGGGSTWWTSEIAYTTNNAYCCNRFGFGNFGLNMPTVIAWQTSTSSSAFIKAFCVTDNPVNTYSSYTPSDYTGTSTATILDSFTPITALTYIISTSSGSTMDLSTTTKLISSANFGLAIIITLLFVIILGFIFNNMHKKKKDLSIHK